MRCGSSAQHKKYADKAEAIKLSKKTSGMIYQSNQYRYVKEDAQALLTLYLPAIFLRS